MSLLEIQRGFRDLLVHGELSSAAGFADAALPGFQVYRNNYRSQLMACLAEAYPLTEQWLGGDAFGDAAAIHVDQCVPDSWTLDLYPTRFPETLRSIYAGDPEVAELAALELALGQAFVAGDADPIDPNSLSEVDWDHAVLGLVPSLSIHRCKTNASEIWSSLRNEEMPPAAAKLPESSCLFVWRIGERCHFRITSDAEGEALRAVGSGENFGALCTRLAAVAGQDEAIGLAGKWLAQWLSDQLIVAVN